MRPTAIILSARALAAILAVSIILVALVGVGVSLDALRAPQEPTEATEVVVTEEVQRSAKHSFAVFTQHGVAHGCAVEGKAITNAHVILDKEGKPLGFRYGFTDGPEGQGFVAASGTTADLAILDLATPPTRYAVRALDTPKIGDTLTWVEYDWREPGAAFADRHRSAKVLRLVAGAVILDEVPIDGASGGCAYNAAGEVVGLVTFSLEGAGGVTGIYGPWGIK